MRSPCLLALLACFGLASAACNKKDEAAPDQAKVSDKKEAVPDDFVLNSWLPEQEQIQGVRGVDGGAAAVMIGDAGGGAVAGEPQTTQSLTVQDPGAEPRAPQVYAFAANKVEKRVAVVTMEEAGGGDQDAAQPPLKMTLELMPKKEGAKTLMQLRVTKFDILATSEQDKALVAQAAPTLAAAAGLGAQIELKPDGTTGEIGFALPQNQAGMMAARNLVPMITPVIEVLAPPLPKDPIGVGAKWTQAITQEDQGLKVTVTTRYELTALDKDTLTIKASIERKAPKQPLPEPPGATVQIDGSGTYEWVIKKTHVAQKAVGESSTIVKQSAPGRGEATHTLKTKTTLDAAG